MCRETLSQSQGKALIYASVFVATETCLPRLCLATASLTALFRLSCVMSKYVGVNTTKYMENYTE
jgi:hypothetical protein